MLALFFIKNIFKHFDFLLKLKFNITSTRFKLDFNFIKSNLLNKLNL